MAFGTLVCSVTGPLLVADQSRRLRSMAAPIALGTRVIHRGVMDETNGLTTTLPRFEVGPTVAIDAPPAAARHIAAWTVDQKVLALHEAGHAGAAALLGIPVKSIDITGRFQGETKLASADNDQMPMTL